MVKEDERAPPNAAARRGQQPAYGEAAAQVLGVALQDVFNAHFGHLS
jgi:hypothetical protein